MKMINAAPLISLVVINVLLSACHSEAPKPDNPPTKNGAWSDQMQKMAADVRDLIPYVYDADSFRASRNHDKISAILKNFSDHAHKITPQMGESLLGDDPLVAFSIASLGDDLKRASAAFDQEQVDYSRAVTKNSITHCFACHSLTQIGSVAHWDLKGLNQLDLKPTEKADLLVASRDYDKAIQYMEQQISSDDFLSSHPFEYESMLRRYLALSIRAENDPVRAQKAMAKVAAQSHLPHYILEQVHGWQVSLRQWIRESKRGARKTAPLKQAADRIARASRLQQYPQDHAGDVEYLRATVILHDYLKKHRTAEEESQALLLLGRAYEVMDELGSWNLHEVYYDACVRKAPKTEWAKTCYWRLEASIMQGYSGSSGTHLPTYESDRLKALKEML